MSKRPSVVPATAAILAACAAFTSPPASAAPAEVSVRVEGLTSTVYDRVVRTDGHDIRAASDDQSRRCDGTNNDMNPAPGPTATAATVDAMSLLGKDFDAQWYPGFDDYFITRWGDDAAGANMAYDWGILVNRVFTPVGGCQFRVRDGDEVLWVLDAFGPRPFMWIDGGPTEAVVGQPVNVPVNGYPAENGALTPSPSPYAGAVVSAVNVNGRPAAAGIATPGTTNASGIASVTFHTTGWQRLKARDRNASSPASIPSNSIDVCVKASAGAPACAGQPANRVPVQVPGTGAPATPTPGATPTPAPTAAPTPAPTAAPGSTPTPVPGAAPVPTPGAGAGPGQTPVVSAIVDAAGPASRRGLVDVRWTVTTSGDGIARWALSSRPTADPKATLTERATGTGAATSAELRLPTGLRSTTFLTLTDGAGRTASSEVGDALVPLDDRSSKVKRKGRWSATTDTGAWLGKVSRGGKGATLSSSLGAGTPVVLVRGVTKSARIELRAGGRREVYAIKGSATKATREITLSKAVRKGTFTVRVLSGTVGVDGVGLG